MNQQNINQGQQQQAPVGDGGRPNSGDGLGSGFWVLGSVLNLII
jgi:hypothetical protein